MKNFLLFLMVMVVNALWAQSEPTVKWKTMTSALQGAAKDNRLIFVEIHAEWCVPCRIMERTTFRDSTVMHTLHTQFHPVRLDVDSEEKIICAGKERTTKSCVLDVWKLEGVPAFVLLSPEGKYLVSVMRFLDAKELQILLKDFLKSRKSLLEKAQRGAP